MRVRAAVWIDGVSRAEAMQRRYVSSYAKDMCHSALVPRSFGKGRKVIVGTATQKDKAIRVCNGATGSR
ncbi:hypothetical protein SERLADRAFT_476337 [Serpula lacrymans var. lacrymans S7.9]|uniref:Uncharacterized protein n=1 Tax=Serpula lacrymans var. lacrymans (strain S7.9) TaxID=578457 RepID=F8P792_SERL9|nr:uncharacterized protein SERLADRAFT_476337 [Serpula lacrymans var. lacrymans S7.9]EGO21308.1 hypothetical protein SERLADRAFT_476337 [Serpula lacrymans var. lacrymans S7.9]